MRNFPNQEMDLRDSIQGMSGLSQRSNGVKYREVCSADMRSVEPMKMNAIQSATGSQDLSRSEKRKAAL